MSIAKLFVALVVLAVVFGIGLSILAARGQNFRPEKAEVLWTFEFRILLAFWVRIDRRGRSLSLPFEFDGFVFFAWAIALPYYLYRTHGKRGLLAAFAVCALYVTPDVIANFIRLTRTAS